jgi:hypothetical protein
LAGETDEILVSAKEPTVDSQRSSKNDAILTSVAESIGATLGTIAAKAGSVQKVLTDKVTGVKPKARRVAKSVVKKVTRKRTALRGKKVRKSRASAPASRRARRKS